MQQPPEEPRAASEGGGGVRDGATGDGVGAQLVAVSNVSSFRVTLGDTAAAELARHGAALRSFAEAGVVDR